MSQELVPIWRAVQEALRHAVDPADHDIWLAPLRPVSLVGAVLTVEAPGGIHGWVTGRFAGRLHEAVEAVLGSGARVVVALEGAAAEAAPRAADARHAGFDEIPLNPKYTFGQFVIGDSNRLAHAAALAVAELPGQAYSPLFVYGPPGVGKTHLLHSIGNYVRAYGAEMSVRYVTGERFTNEFLTALRAKDLDRFKGRYRHNDLLLVDDVQFLQAKTHTEEEFFHTFNAIQDAGAQLVLTCDRLPRDLEAMQDRLRERFQAGLVCDIAAPDPATRVAVLRKRVQHDGIALEDPAVLELLARRIPSNVRALEGALIRVVAFASLTGRSPDLALAGEVLDELYGPVRETTRAGMPAPALGPPSISRIQELTCEAFGLSRTELLSPSRKPHVTWARQVAMFLAREHTAASLPAIGQAFGGRTHTTVLHAVRRTTARLADDPEAQRVVHTLSTRL